jgi:hypothetical protein
MVLTVHATHCSSMLQAALQHACKRCRQPFCRGLGIAQHFLLCRGVMFCLQNVGISPSQRKLLTIGLELVANPSILFVDEPTTGLDSKAAMSVRLWPCAQVAMLDITLPTVESRGLACCAVFCRTSHAICAMSCPTSSFE